MPIGLSKKVCFRVLKMLLLAFSFFTACTQGQKQNTLPVNANASPQQIAKQDTFSRGSVFFTTCSSIPSQSYWVYLPFAYSKQKSFPVIYFFDPHADGKLPLGKYKSLSEEFNVVLIGCNNSKNGMPMQESISSAGTMIDDAESKFYLNKTRKYMAGFSGGARVACAVALQSADIAGVIACSGSYFENGKSFPTGISIASVAGEKDFNYHEMLRFDQSLDTSTLHLLFTNLSTHQWPDEETMHDVFVYLQACEMKSGLTPPNKKVIATYIDAGINKAEMLKKQNKSVQALMIYNKLALIADGIVDNTNLKKEIDKLNASNEVAVYKQKVKTMALQEQNKMQQYAQDFIVQDINWWKTEIAQLKKISQNKTDQLKASMHARLLGYMGILCYSYSTKAVKINAAEAEKFLSIYKITEPENSEAYFLSAAFNANNNKNEIAVDEMIKAIALGFKEKSRFAEFGSLNSIINQPVIKAALDTIR